MGGDLRFVDAFFGFLSRRTPLLNSPNAVDQVKQLAIKYGNQNKNAKTNTNNANKQTTTTQSESTSTSAHAPEPAAAAAASSSSSAPVSAIPDAADESEEDKLPTPINNGGVTDKYRWSQTLAETSVSIPLPAGTSSKQLKVTIEPNYLYAALTTGEKTVFIDGVPDEKIDSADATWTLENDKGGKSLEIFLPKLNKMSWWKCVVAGDPKINTKKIVPENSKLEDLDGDTRGTVEKMMFDQRAKQMGKPTSDDITKEAALKRFMAMHPEMDFSNAKVRQTDNWVGVAVCVHLVELCASVDVCAAMDELLVCSPCVFLLLSFYTTAATHHHPASDSVIAHKRVKTRIGGQPRDVHTLKALNLI